MNRYFPFFALILLIFSGSLVAAEPPKMTADEFNASLKYQQGEIKLPGGKATLNVPPQFRYLDPADAKRVLEQAWGNPSGENTLGMLFPANAGPLDQSAWGVVISYTDDGHVSDSDADAIDYANLLKEMQDGTKEENERRVQAGFGRVELVGWAEQPQYDKDSRKMYWAKDLKIGDTQDHTLNYNVRVLGRDGVLILNAVAGMDQLAEIKGQMKQVTAFTNFGQGSQYTDFNADTDKIATYGLAALVGGAVAAKVGLFAKIGLLLVAGKKFIFLGLVAFGGFFARFYKRRKDKVKEGVG